MRRVLVVVSWLLVSTLTAAQSQAEPTAKQDGAGWRQRHDKELTSLFAKLKASTSEANAQQLSTRIWSLWYQSGDGGADILMGQARHTLRLGQHQAAVELVDEVLQLTPKYAEAWNLRALILFNMGRDAESALNLKRALALEPRHFGAMTGLAHINIRARNWSGALKAIRSALEIHPFLGERKLLPRLEKLAKEKDL